MTMCCLIKKSMALVAVISFLLFCSGCFLFVPCRVSEADFDTPQPLYDDAAAELLREYQAAQPDDFAGDVVGGLCGEEGPRFLFRFTSGHSWQYDYFDAETNEYIGSRIDGSGFGGVLLAGACPGGQYVSQPVQCFNPIVTELVTDNNRYTIGDSALP